MPDILTAIRDKIIRFRRTRGFGVHSPFAFGYITMVLTCRYPYYAFEDLQADVAHLDGALRPTDALTLFRVLDQSQPKTVAMIPHTDRSVSVTVKAWSELCSFTAARKADFIIIAEPDDVAAKCGDVTGKTLFFTRRAFSSFKPFRENLNTGMTFTNGHTAIAVCNPALPRQDFEISY